MADCDGVTAGNEEYLEWIYRLSKEKSTVNPQDLARALKVSPPSVTAMLKRLTAGGFIEYRTYQGISLTERGQAIAVVMVRRHALLERLLTDVLGVPWEQADAIACQIEHYVTEDIEERLAAFLGNPTTCPHGQRIDLESRDNTRPLTEVPVPGEAEVACISDEDADFLVYLSGMGLRPGARVAVEGVAPFNGPLTIRVGGAAHAIGRDVAGRVRVVDALPEE